MKEIVEMRKGGKGLDWGRGGEGSGGREGEECEKVYGVSVKQNRNFGISL